MEALVSQIFSVGFGIIVPFIFVLTIVVFFHELGHFYVARRCGVTVEVFSVGFGRPLASWYDKHGTQWKIGWMPLGGYVKFLGDENAASAPDIEAIEKMDAQTAKPHCSTNLWVNAPPWLPPAGGEFHIGNHYFCGALCRVGPTRH